MKLFDLNEKEWTEWVATRPKLIQELCLKFPPNILFRMKDTGQLVEIASYFENNTLMVNVLQKHNPGCLMERAVFGIDPENLERYDDPTKN